MISRSKEVEVDRQCGKKIRFRSHKTALNFIGAKFMTLRLPNIQAYRCPQCHCFHIGHKREPS